MTNILNWNREKAIAWLMEQYENEELDADTEDQIAEVRQECIDQYISDGCLDDDMHEDVIRIHDEAKADKYKEYSAMSDEELQEACNIVATVDFLIRLARQDDDEHEVLNDEEEGLEGGHQ